MKLKQISVCWWLSVILLGSAAAAFGAEDNAEIAKQLTGKLEAINGFDAQYEAVSAAGRTIAFRIRYAKPNKMRADLETINTVTLFDGQRYLYYDQQGRQAIMLDAIPAHQEMASLNNAMNRITWAMEKERMNEPAQSLFPTLIMELHPDRLDVALELSPHPNRYSWIRELTQAKAWEEKDGKVIVTKSDGNRATIFTISRASGMLEKQELTENGETRATVILKSITLTAPEAQSFVLDLPKDVEVRDQKSDPTMLQQLLLASYRAMMEHVLTVAKSKWSGLTAMEKQQLPSTVRVVFDRVFRLSEKPTLDQIRRSINNPDFAAKIKKAYDDAEALQRFREDNPEITDDTAPAAWKSLIIGDATQAILYDILRTIDQQVVNAYRTQGFQRTEGMEENARKEVILSLTEPIFQAFKDMVEPFIRRELEGLFK